MPDDAEAWIDYYVCRGLRVARRDFPKRLDTGLKTAAMDQLIARGICDEVSLLGGVQNSREGVILSGVIG